MDEYEALRAVTINPAEHIGIADRVGSLEEGKDADVVIVDGCPFDVTGVMGNAGKSDFAAFDMRG